HRGRADRAARDLAGIAGRLGRLRGRAGVMLSFIVPGPVDQVTGGYIFARRIVAELRARGDDISVVELAGRFPDADATAQRAAAAALDVLPDGAVAVIDGLGL